MFMVQEVCLERNDYRSSNQQNIKPRLSKRVILQSCTPFHVYALSIMKKASNVPMYKWPTKSFDVNILVKHPLDTFNQPYKLPANTIKAEKWGNNSMDVIKNNRLRPYRYKERLNSKKTYCFKSTSRFLSGLWTFRA